MQAVARQKPARWEPPAKPSGPAFKIDDRVLAKVVEVNPALAAGRTAAQVRKDLMGKQVAAAITPAASDIDHALSFFLHGKADALQQRMQELAAKRRELDAEEQQAKLLFKQQLQAFVALLDAEMVRAHAPASRAKHHDMLSACDITVADVLGRTK